MGDSLQEELKSFEKELSVLLVRFMKICDAVEAAKTDAGPAQMAPKAPAAPAMPSKTQSEPSFVAYA